MGPLEIRCLLAAITGVVSHILYFIRGYRVPETLNIIIVHITSGSALLIWHLLKNGFRTGLLMSLAISSSYLIALFTSIAIYRLFFHPLRRFPGPMFAKVSRLYSVFFARNLYDYHTQWNRKYGDIVRIGPNELLIISIDGQQQVHGPHAKSSKRHTFTELVHYNGAPNLGTRMDDGHRTHRQVWDRAFSPKALERYEAQARQVCRTWLDKLSEAGNAPVDTTLYASLIPVDNMGMMGYSTDLGTVKAGREDRMIYLLHCFAGVLGRIGGLTWPAALATDLNLSADQTEFQALACRLVDEREKNDDEDKEDILKYLFQDFKSEKPKAISSRNMIYADSQFIMVAGVDTISATLAHCFYYLARDAALRARVREELAPVFGQSIDGEFAQSDLTGLALLNAVIDESLRMHPPTCNTVSRTTPPEGMTVDGAYIPGDVTVIVGIHTMHRSAKFFKQPDEFVPERWTTRPDLIIERRAFFPFLIGAYACAGRKVALIVLRLAIAYTVWNYDFEFAPGDNGTRFVEDSKNLLLLRPGKLECVFRKI